MSRWRYKLLVTWPDGNERVESYVGGFRTRRGAQAAADRHAEIIRDIEGPPVRFEVECVPAYL